MLIFLKTYAFVLLLRQVLSQVSSRLENANATISVGINLNTINLLLHRAC